MKSINVGVMPKDKYIQRTIAIAKGELKRKKNEPKVWFNSMRSLCEVLSDKNIQLLQIIEEKHPNSIKELSVISGRQESNLSRTLNTMEQYGFVELRKLDGKRAKKPIAKASRFNIIAGQLAY